MSVQYKCFVLSIKNSMDEEEEFNRFLRSVKVLTIHREFTSCGENSYWCFAVEYLYSKNDQSESNKSKTGKPKIDYKEVLSPEDFALFAKLRDWRKEIANIDKVPLYTIFNNEQLAQIAREKITTNAGLRGISGVGETRAKKYCEAVGKIIKENNISG